MATKTVRIDRPVAESLGGLSVRATRLTGGLRDGVLLVALAPHAGIRFDLALAHHAGAAVAAERQRIAAAGKSSPLLEAAPRPGWSMV